MGLVKRGLRGGVSRGRPFPPPINRSGGGPVNHRLNELKFWILVDHTQKFYESSN